MTKAPFLVWLPLVFIVGGLVGAYGPTEELRTREARAKAEKEKSKAKQKASGAFGSFAQIVNIPDEAKRPRRLRHERQNTNASAMVSTNEAASVADGVASVDATTNAVAAQGRQFEKRLSPEDLKARIDEAADLWRTRIEVSKASAFSKLGLDDAGKASFESAIAAMNDRLRDSMQIVADQIASADELTPELGIRLMGDVSALLAETYDSIGACAGENRRNDVSKLNIADFIDPSVAEPFVAVQDKLGASK